MSVRIDWISVINYNYILSQNLKYFNLSNNHKLFSLTFPRKRIRIVVSEIGKHEHRPFLFAVAESDTFGTRLYRQIAPRRHRGVRRRTPTNMSDSVQCLRESLDKHSTLGELFGDRRQARRRVTCKDYNLYFNFRVRTLWHNRSSMS